MISDFKTCVLLLPYISVSKVCLYFAKFFSIALLCSGYVYTQSCDQMYTVQMQMEVMMMVQMEVSDIWKSKYEEWLEMEVFSNLRDWDAIISSPTAFLECKAIKL